MFRVQIRDKNIRRAGRNERFDSRDGTKGIRVCESRIFGIAEPEGIGVFREIVLADPDELQGGGDVVVGAGGVVLDLACEGGGAGG